MKKMSVKKLVLLAMLAAMAYIMVSLIRIPVVLFLKYEPKDVIITIAGFLCGPLAGAAISLVVSLLEMVTVSDTELIGCVMNVISTCSFACIAAAVYKKHRSQTGALVGLLAGFLHSSVALNIGSVYGGMNLYNNGFAGGIVAIFFAFCNVFVSNGMNAALIQKKDTTVEDYSTVLYLNLSIAFVLYAVMFFCAPLIAELYEKEALTLILRVMSLTFFANALKSVLSAYVSNNLEFKQFFRSTIIGTV